MCHCKFCECNLVSLELFCASLLVYFCVVKRKEKKKKHIILKCRDIANNGLSGDIPVNGSFTLFTPIRFSFLSLISLSMGWLQ